MKGRVISYGNVVNGSVVLEEVMDPSYVPSLAEISEYAIWIGMNPDSEEDKQLLWIPKEALRAPLPEDWKPCRNIETGDVYYFNFKTGESSWLHPNDAYYKKMFSDEKIKVLNEKSTIIDSGSSSSSSSSSSNSSSTSSSNSSSNSGGYVSGRRLPSTTVKNTGRLVLDPLSLSTVFTSATRIPPISSSSSSLSGSSFPRDNITAALSLPTNSSSDSMKKTPQKPAEGAMFDESSEAVDNTNSSRSSRSEASSFSSLASPKRRMVKLSTSTTPSTSFLPPNHVDAEGRTIGPFRPKTPPPI